VRKFAKWWLPVIVWMGVIFIGSSIGSLPSVGGETSDAIVHRVAHVIEYAIFGALMLRAVSKERPIRKHEVIMTVISATVYGATDEIHQRFTPGRSSEASAVLFDAVGGLLGAWVYRWWCRRTLAAQHDVDSESVNQRISATTARQFSELTGQRIGEAANQRSGE
jgi:VanZ family protein